MTCPACFDGFRHSSVPNLNNQFRSQWVTNETKKGTATFLKVKWMNSPFVNAGVNYQQVLKTILQGNAASLLQQKAGCEKTNDHMGGCIFAFGNLKECPCDELSRKKTKHRDIYEAEVMQRVEQILNSGKTDLSITVLGSGFLFAEFVLLMKVLNALKAQRWNGNLRLHFIDSSYTPMGPSHEARAKKRNDLHKDFIVSLVAAITCGIIVAASGTGIAKSKKDSRALPIAMTALSGVGAAYFIYRLKTAYEAWKKVKDPVPLEEISTGNPKYNDSRSSRAIPDFMSYLAAALPPGSRLKAYYFSNSTEYSNTAIENPKFRNDLLIGSDLDGAYSDVPLLRGTQNQGGRSVFLFKNNGSAYLDQEGKITNLTVQDQKTQQRAIAYRTHCYRDQVLASASRTV